LLDQGIAVYFACFAYPNSQKIGFVDVFILDILTEKMDTA